MVRSEIVIAYARVAVSVDLDVIPKSDSSRVGVRTDPRQSTQQNQQKRRNQSPHSFYSTTFYLNK